MRARARSRVLSNPDQKKCIPGLGGRSFAVRSASRTKEGFMVPFPDRYRRRVCRYRSGSLQIL